MENNRARTRPIVAALAVVALTSGPSVPTLEARRAPSAGTPATRALHELEPETRTRVREAYATMPLRFEPAGDRAGSDAEFVARGDGYGVDLARGHAKIVVGPTSDKRRLAIGMQLAGGSPLAAASVRNPMPGVTNYLIGNDPLKWRTGVRSYAEVEYHDVYPGVDVVYYGNQRQIEYDFIVAPGASYRAIALAFDAAAAVRIDPTGDLVIATAAGNLVQHAPVIYQYKDGKREPVRGGYVHRARNRFGFWVGKHDPHLPLVIDPVLTYATYLGGAREERAGGVAVDAQGNIYLTGLTGASNFPVAAAPNLTHGRDNWDAFVVKLNATGDQFQYATYLGGSGYEEPADIDVDPAGNAYVIGTTSSWDFPTLHAIQSSLGGVNDCFVAKLDATGAVVYSTYLGGKQDESGGGIAVDGSGRAYLTGSTFSPDFPTVNAMQPSVGGNAAFRTTDGGHTWIGLANGLRASAVLTFAIDPTNGSTVYAGTYSDGVFASADGGATWTATSAELPPLPVNALGVAPDGTVYVANDAGVYRSSDRGASWIDLQVWTPVSALVVDPASGTVYIGLSSPYPGVFTSIDRGQTWNDTGLRDATYSLALSQSVIYAGTANGVFKNVAGSGWQPTSVADGHLVLAAVMSISANPNDAGQVYAGTQSGLFYTTSGGAEWTAVPVFAGAPILNVAMAPPSTVYVATAWGSGMTDDGGMTWRQVEAGAANFCFVVDPVVPTTVYAGNGTSGDVFVSRISADGASLEYSTYLGGTGSEWASDIAIDSAGAAYVAGTTQSTDFPVMNPFQATAGGLMDVFVAKLSETGSLVYGTYLGGWGSDYYPRIAVDSAGQAHVVGLTLSHNFPVANAYQPSHGGGYSDVFVTTLNQAGSGLVYSTFLGGDDQEVDWSQSLGPAVALGPSGETIVTGATRSKNFPTRDASQSVHAGGSTDAFVASFDPVGHLQYSTYLGGSGDDYGRRVAVDPTGSIVVVGATTSTDFPTRLALQPANAGADDVFVARIASSAPPSDTVAPTTTVSMSGTRGSNGWYRSAVQIALTAADDANGSGVAFIEYSVNQGVFQRYGAPFSIAAQGTTVVRARAIDTAGNVENPPAAVTVTIDAEAPAIDISSPRATDYRHTDVLQLSFAASDAVSGLASGNPTAMLDASIVVNGPIQLLDLSLGPHTLAVSASDQAGNAAVQTVQFRVTATIDSLIAATNMFAAQGRIDERVVRSLLGKLSDAKQALDAGKLSAARGKLLDFRDQVSSQSGHFVAADAAHLLLVDDDYVLSTM